MGKGLPAMPPVMSDAAVMRWAREESLAAQAQTARLRGSSVPRVQAVRCDGCGSPRGYDACEYCGRKMTNG